MIACCRFCSCLMTCWESVWHCGLWCCTVVSVAGSVGVLWQQFSFHGRKTSWCQIKNVATMQYHFYFHCFGIETKFGQTVFFFFFIHSQLWLPSFTSFHPSFRFFKIKQNKIRVFFLGESWLLLTIQLSLTGPCWLACRNALQTRPGLKFRQKSFIRLVVT